MQLCRGEQRPCFKLLVKWGRMVPRHRPAVKHTESHGCIRQEPGLSRSPPAPCKLTLYNLGLAASCLWTIPTLMLYLKYFTHIHMHMCTQTCAHVHRSRSIHARSSHGQPAAARDMKVPANCCCCGQSLSQVWLFVTPRTVPCQVPLSMRFSRPEDWITQGKRGNGKF